MGRGPPWVQERVDAAPGSGGQVAGGPLSPDACALLQAPYFWPSNCWEPENTDYGEQWQDVTPGAWKTNAWCLGDCRTERRGRYPTQSFSHHWHVISSLFHIMKKGRVHWKLQPLEGNGGREEMFYQAGQYADSVVPGRTKTVSADPSFLGQGFREG